MKSLIVDDSRTTRAILRRIVSELDFEVVEAGDGLEALEQVSKHGMFDIALVDWNMPNMNGYEFVKTVRLQKDLTRMAIMMVTTETEISQIVKALAVGANEYVMKPFDKEVIVDKFKLLGLI